MKEARKININPEPGLEGFAYNSKEYAGIARALTGFLASTYLLYHKTLYYHWNVTGSRFVELHALFDQHYNDLQAAGDLLAERLRAIGYYAPGTLTEFINASAIKEDRKLPESDMQMIENLLQDHETCVMEARNALRTAEDANDMATADLIIRRINFHDKAAWMLRSLLS